MWRTAFHIALLWLNYFTKHIAVHCFQWLLRSCMFNIMSFLVSHPLVHSELVLYLGYYKLIFSKNGNTGISLVWWFYFLWCSCLIWGLILRVFFLKKLQHFPQLLKILYLLEWSACFMKLAGAYLNGIFLPQTWHGVFVFIGFFFHVSLLDIS